MRLLLAVVTLIVPLPALAQAPPPSLALSVLPEPAATETEGSDSVAAPLRPEAPMRERLLRSRTALSVPRGEIDVGLQIGLPDLAPSLVAVAGLGRGLTVRTALHTSGLVGLVFGAPAFRFDLGPSLTLVERPGLAAAVGVDLSLATASGFSDEAGAVLPYVAVTAGGGRWRTNAQVTRYRRGYRDVRLMASAGAAYALTPRTTVLAEVYRLGRTFDETLGVGVRHGAGRQRIEVGVYTWLEALRRGTNDIGPPLNGHVAYTVRMGR